MQRTPPPQDRLSRDSRDNGSVSALLGPTNTGKTHRAIERMLELDSGMIGLPLRLLAREVYDRVSARVGEQAVALLTGEEKRVPARPRYWICTVEAMPSDLAVDFLAIDEIQLVGHRERGHVFTDRMLHARGRVETWFLGSDTVDTLLWQQLSAPHIGRLPRLSQLRYAGQASVRTLPRRSAVVAFSMQQVYALADLIRVRRGGAAVVLGALSPRVRNAQVAMYQAGEVDFLVATDAIGMGLNLDLDHVALAAQVKFDGHETRDLETPELAQIVGRAGRYLRDGTFGTLSPLPELPPARVRQLEGHEFPKQRFAYYRNAQLDFSAVGALLSSLSLPPPHPALRSAPVADDVELLRAFGLRAEVQRLCVASDRVELLWDVCRIPNYEKRIPEHQAEHLLPLFVQLAQDGRVQQSYLDAQLRKLERYDGDIDMLLARLAAVRTWLYVSHQPRWVESAQGWQERARALEDRLGDLLHERLLTRFVAARSHHTAAVSSAPSHADHHPFAKLAALSPGLTLASSQPATTRGSWAERIVQAGFDDFALSAQAEITFQGERLARLKTGTSLLCPALKLTLAESTEAGARARVERRLQAHVKDLVAHLLAPLYAPERSALLEEPDSAALRGVLYQLEQGLGSARRRDVAPQLALLRAPERDALRRWGVELGRMSVFSTAMLHEDRRKLREALCYAWQPQPTSVRSELDRPSSWQLRTEWDRQSSWLRGYIPLGHWAVRADLVERLVAELTSTSREPAPAAIGLVQRHLGCDETRAAAILRALPKAGPRKRRGRGGRPRQRQATQSPPPAQDTAQDTAQPSAAPVRAGGSQS